jgi:predicted Zn-dependent protease
LACALAAGVFGGARPLYRSYQEKRAVAQAQVFLAQEEYSKAALSARRALLYNPRNLEACRLIAQMAERAGSPEALEWWRRVADLDSSLTNRFSLAGASLLFEPPPFPAAQKIFDSLAPSEKQSAVYHRLAAARALRLNRLGEAEEHFKEALRFEPAKENDQLNLAMLQLNSPDDETRAAARHRLEGFFDHEQFGPIAFRALISHYLHQNEPGEAAAFSRQLLAHLQGTFEDQIQHLNILLANGDADYNRYLDFLMYEAGTNAVACALIGGHLLSSGKAETALEWLSNLPSAVQRLQPIPRLAAECHVILGDWGGLENFLREKRWKENEPLRFALLARALREQQDEEFARVNWERAAKLGVDRFDTAHALATLAESWGWEKETEELLWKIAERFPGNPRAAESIERFYHSRGNTWGLYRFYSGRIKTDPDHPAVKNNLALVCLLLKLSLEDAHQMAKEAHEQRPDHPEFAATFAYSLHLQGKTRDGLSVFDGLTRMQLERPGVATYYAILLAAAGETAKADHYFARARSAPLLPEEQQLLGGKNWR